MADGRIIYLNNSAMATLVESTDAEVEIDERGIASAKLSYHCKYDSAVELVKRLYYHPEYTWLRRKKAVIKREEGCVARVDATFEGVDPESGSGGGTGESGSEEDPFNLQATLTASTDTDPIESHPKFLQIAGTPSDPTTWLNGARFDKKTSEFLGFSPTDGAPNKKAGVKSFLSPSMIYSVTKVYPDQEQAGPALAKRVGVIVNSPPSSPVRPNPGGTRRWLRTAITAEQVGAGVKVTEQYRLSGQEGWDPDIYDTE
jgi:hypothetical protein